MVNNVFEISFLSGDYVMGKREYAKSMRVVGMAL
jgi:hypothetical protein